MTGERTTTRAYRSAVRTQGAQQTRLAVIEAARELFVTHGYGATTVEAIAARAGVGRATVFTSVGGKPALMRAAHHAAILGGDDPRPPREGLADRWAGVTRAAERLDAYAAVLADVFEGVGPIHEALVRAASEAPELGDQLAELDRERHEAATRTAELMDEELRAGLSAARAADILWVHNDPLLWQALHARRGWSKAEFTDWLARSLRSQLLD